MPTRSGQPIPKKSNVLFAKSHGIEHVLKTKKKLKEDGLILPFRLCNEAGFGTLDFGCHSCHGTEDVMDVARSAQLQVL